MLEESIRHFSYLGVFVALVLAGLGVPIPEEATILAAGVLAHRGVVRWWLAFPVCFAGVLVGDVLLYWSGRRWGEGVLEHGLVRRLLSPERIERLGAAYRRHGVRIVLVARHLVGVRAAAFVVAGVVGLPFGRFLAADTVAALPGLSLGFGLAYLFTDRVEALASDLHRMDRWLVVLALVAATAWLAWRGWRAGRVL